MTLATLLRLAGASALLAGVLRTLASFIPGGDAPGTGLEILYMTIDVLLVFGLLGIYACQYDRAGVPGLFGFVLALTGTASIVGPDGKLGEVDLYAAGALLIAVGLVILAAGTWKARRLPPAVPALWVVSTVVGVGGFAVGNPPIAFMISGVAFGLAFALAGWSLIRTSAAPSPRA